MDKIFIKKLCVHAYLTLGPKPIYQPILLSISIPTDLIPAATTDEVSQSIDYAKLTAIIKGGCHDKRFNSILDLVYNVKTLCPAGSIEITAEQPKGHFRAEYIGVKLTYDNRTTKHTFFIDRLQLAAVIGINPEERSQKQPVLVDVQYDSTTSNLSEVSNFVAELVESSNFFTIERISMQILTSLQKKFGSSEVTVKVIKSKALTFSDGAGVEMTLHSKPKIPKPLTKLGSEVIAYIAFGSNVAPRIDHINKALDKMKVCNDIKLIDTSFLYESKPMYHESLENFYNGVVKVATKLYPLELLTYLKRLEQDAGRVTRYENGPREIDLDILFYSDLLLTTAELTIPHPRTVDREFVLKPLSDLWDPLIGYWLQLNRQGMIDSVSKYKSVQKVLPIPRNSTHFAWQSKTFVMGILNINESFSEPGTTDEAVAIEMVKRVETQGVDILDIGVVTRRPGSTETITTEEEIQKVTSMIHALRRNGVKVPISVDAYKSVVAAAAIDAGADIINDVGMATLDPSMIDVAASKAVPIVFEHCRGHPSDLTLYAGHSNESIIGSIINDLHPVVEKAIAAGVFRWNIIIDPGIGYWKGNKNFEILRNLRKLTGAESPLYGFPILVGCSRKGFIGDVTGVGEPILRGAGTMASSAACISAGADIIRVHDVLENVHVAKFSDAFWRTTED